MSQRALVLAALALGCVAAAAHPVASAALQTPPQPAQSTVHVTLQAAPQAVPTGAANPQAEIPRPAAEEQVEVAEGADLADPDEADGPKRTPISPEAAAHYLADAWLAEEHQPVRVDTLAVLWAHWALETGRGERMAGYNFAGLKGSAPRGGSHRLWTREKRHASTEKVQHRFRAYETPEAGARDYLRLLKRKYPRALRAARRGSPIDFVDALQEGRYFTEEPQAYLKAIVKLTREFLEDAGAQRLLAARAKAS